MTDYGVPPEVPSPPPYTQQAPTAPGNPYLPQSPQPGSYGSGAPSGAPLASWIQRVLATIIDQVIIGLIWAVPLIIGIVGLVRSTTVTHQRDASGVRVDHLHLHPYGAIGIIIIVVGYVAALLFGLYDYVFRQGRTGYTIGKGFVGIKVIGEATGEPLGAGKSFLRQLCHGLEFTIGYLWPLWDAKHQTFADKIMSSIVIQQPKP